MNANQLGDVFAYQYQCAGMDEATLVALARHVRDALPADERAAFLDVATMSGLPLGLFMEGDRVRFCEPHAPDVLTDGTVLYVLSSGLIGVRPDGCTVSRVLVDPTDVEPGA